MLPSSFAGEHAVPYVCTGTKRCQSKCPALNPEVHFKFANMQRQPEKMSFTRPDAKLFVSTNLFPRPLRPAVRYLASHLVQTTRARASRKSR